MCIYIILSIAWENTVETQQFSPDPIINNKIKSVVTGLQPSIQQLFMEFPSDRDKELVADFILACIRQENAAVRTKKSYLVALAYLSRHFDNSKRLEEMTSKDLASFVDSYQKSRDEDPHQSWIATQRTYGSPLLKFFKWLAYPDMTPQERKRLPKDKHPPVLKGFVLQRKKGSKTPVKTKDIWNDEDTAVFLKYCTENPSP
jgi:integrase-like protein